MNRRILWIENYILHFKDNKNPAFLLHRPWTSLPTASPRLEGYTLPCKKRRLTGTSTAATSAAEGTAAGLAGSSAAGSQAAGGLAGLPTAEGSTTAERLNSPTASVRLETASEGDTASCHTTCPRGFCNKVPEPIPVPSSLPWLFHTVFIQQIRRLVI